MSSKQLPFCDGTADFSVPYSDCVMAKTYYKIYGTLRESSQITPLVCLHGGPGAVHGVIEHLKDLTEKWHIPVVFYDQIGNGHSTHFRDKMGDTQFWKPELFIAELENLLKHLHIEDNFDLFGQSVSHIKVLEQSNN